MKFYLGSLIGLKRPILLPYNYGKEDCPKLGVGDILYAVIENEPIDFIAASCGMSDTRFAIKGSRRKWKVLEVYEDGNLLLVSKKDKSLRTMTKYMTWSDGNLVTVPMTLAHGTLLIRFFYDERAAVKPPA